MNTICRECETVAHCLKNGCVPKQPSKDETLKLALEALETPHPGIRTSFTDAMKYREQCKEAITAIKQALAAPVQEPDELKHIDEQDCLLDVDEKAWRSLIENRGGCRCHISPPCGACSNPISEEELNEVDYTYTTPPAQPAPVQDCFWNREGCKECPVAQRQWVGLTDEERDDLLDIYITAEGRARAIEAKLKEKNT